MADVAVSKSVGSQGSAQGLTGSLWTISWRNVFRNKRRTWLTVAAIVFGCFLVSGMRSYQAGMYKQLLEISTEQYPGHADVIHVDYENDQKLEQTVRGATELMRSIEANPDVVGVAPRVMTSSLFSQGEKSYGGMMIGVDFDREALLFNFFARLAEGVLPVDRNEVVIGKVMARNLDIGLGDDVVVLGSQKEGGVAALVLKVSGIFSSGNQDYDRSFAFARLPTVREAYGLGDEVNALTLRLTDIYDADRVVSQIAAEVPDNVSVRGWREIVPETYQAVRLDDLAGQATLVLITVLVLFSIANTFSMMVLERTREFGMLLALGMRPWAIIRQVQIEGMVICLIAVTIATIINTALVYIGLVVGIPVPPEINETFGDFYFMFPERFYPAFSWEGLLLGPVVFFLGIQFAALIGALKILWLKPVTAMRSD